ncbi:MAG: STAS domain-containing protein [Methanobrevibacter sp.]|jgi:anti-sigma B factor antagonist|nr:STAS domain-containing protein [Candidatus Methanovirga meridionalis]
MNIKKKVDNDKITVELSGRLDNGSSHELEKELNENISEINELIFDFKNLEYISSSGLRVILTLKKEMEKSGKKLIIKNTNEFIIDIFKTTNIIKLLDIQ